MTQANQQRPAPNPQSCPVFNKSYINGLIESMLHEMGIERYDYKICHIILDLIQRESLKILNNSLILSEIRASTEQRKVPAALKNKLPAPTLITEEDAQLACQDYFYKHVVQPSILMEMKEVHNHTNQTHLGFITESNILSGATTTDNMDRGPTSWKLNQKISMTGEYPNGIPPHIPEDPSLNTLLPNWTPMLSNPQGPGTQESGGQNT